MILGLITYCLSPQRTVLSFPNLFTLLRNIIFRAKYILNTGICNQTTALLLEMFVFLFWSYIQTMVWNSHWCPYLKSTREKVPQNLISSRDRPVKVQKQGRDENMQEDHLTTNDGGKERQAD